MTTTGDYGRRGSVVAGGRPAVLYPPPRFPGDIAMITTLVMLATVSSALLGHPTDNATNDIVFPIAARTGLSATHQGIPDDALRRMGHAVCNGLDSHLTKLQVVSLMTTGFNSVAPADPLTESEAAYIVGASTAAYCPGHTGDPLA